MQPVMNHWAITSHSESTFFIPFFSLLLVVFLFPESMFGVVMTASFSPRFFNDLVLYKWATTQKSIYIDSMQIMWDCFTELESKKHN